MIIIMMFVIEDHLNIPPFAAIYENNVLQNSPTVHRFTWICAIVLAASCTPNSDKKKYNETAVGILLERSTLGQLKTYGLETFVLVQGGIPFLHPID